MAAKKKTAKKTAKKTTRKTPQKTSKAVAVLEKHLPDPPLEVPKEVLADPRKGAFFRMYFDTQSPTYGSMQGSAIAAGFSKDYAHNITALRPKWLYDFIGRLDFLQIAETHLKEVMMLPNVGQAMGAFGPIFKTETVKEKKKFKNGKTRMINKKIKVPVMVPQVSVIKEKTAVAKIVLPAHSPETYGRKAPGSGNTFIFNLKAARERYNGNSDARVS